MSYCRFSCDDWSSDVYCYEDVNGGYTTHVAGNRLVGEVPKVPHILRASPDEWTKAHNVQMAWLRSAERTLIDLPHAGAMFNDPTPEAAHERLLSLRALGFHVPDHAIEALAEEINPLTKKEAFQ